MTSKKKLRAIGVSRNADEQFYLLVSFNRRPTNDELRWLHDHLRIGIPHRFQIGCPTCVDCDFDPTAEYEE